MDRFRVRLNCIDHYQATPTEFDPQLPRSNRDTKAKPVPRVPVIRIFGATETGQKVCAHVHGAFPYLYVRYSGSLQTEDGGWIHESEYRNKVDSIVVEEKDNSDGKEIGFDEFVGKDPFDNQVRTSLESIEDLFPENLVLLAKSQRAFQAAGNEEHDLPSQAPQVDEARLLSIEEDESGDQSGEELARELGIPQKKRKGSRETYMEQSADQGIEAPLYEDEERLARLRKNGNTIMMPSKGKDMSEHTQGPNSSSELEKLGIRHAGDYSHVDEDAFEIPMEFASDVDNNRFTDTSKMEPLRKRRKARHSPESTGAEINNCEQTDGIGKSDNPVVDAVSEASKKVNSTQREALDSPNGRSQQHENSQKTHTMLASTQSRYHRAAGNKTLSFPVVKDPQDPLTIMKLSQKSNSPTKSSQKSKAKSASFPVSSEPGTSLASFGEKPGVVVDKIVEEKTFQRRRRNCGIRTWQVEQAPPTRMEVQIWADENSVEDLGPCGQDACKKPGRAKSDLAQIDGATQKNRHGFKYSQKQRSTSVQHETQYMSIMSMEIHVNTRGNLVPNPEQDEIASVFWCLQSEDEDLEVNGINEGTHVGIIALSEEGCFAHKFSQQTTVEVEEETSELDLINRMVDIVRAYDPDILTGYEVHNGSWGYMIERARCKYDYDLCDEFSRMKSQSHGRVVDWRGQNKMGFTDYQREPRLLELFKDQINIAPNGIMYAKPEIRKSLLAKMLGEILETRVMVKSGMQIDKDDKTLQRLLNNRQLALKLIANVTYGYTSASFSGRMPCSEIADSIVQTGRETLEKAIALIHSVERWGAEVVYGDTDSLFVYLKGRSKDEAFDIGQEIANTITKMNPRPVKLKFEKVYHPCVLLAKKRYVGFKYENKIQLVPEFDAKGIETVRRDGTPAEQKIEEKALKILFRSSDLSQVKDYFQRQCTKILMGKVSIQDFCFAKEVKLGTYSDKGLPPPGALISTRRMLEDPRAEPQYGERVPYVVITGAPGARLIDRCVAPDVLLHNDNNELDAEYYISKNLIPPLERIFNLVGANVRQWYDEMPKFQRIRRIEAGSLPGDKEMSEKKTLESYMKSSSCIVCGEKLEEEAAMCTRCLHEPDASLLSLRTRLNVAEEKAMDLEKIISQRVIEVLEELGAGVLDW
ncbi:DNA polymerase zeta, partial [Lecanoromycetidae sp. Uapishka_2]